MEVRFILFQRSLLGVSLFVTLFLLGMNGGIGKVQAQNPGVGKIRNWLDNAIIHQTNQSNIIESSGKILIPKTVNKQGGIVYIPKQEWTSGFFPGSMWYMLRLTGDRKWESLAKKYTENLDSIKYFTSHHDVGFMIGSSFLNGYRINKYEGYTDVIIQAAKSLSTRFRPNAGIIQSWNAQSARDWKCPVIIDNMMNLELLFEASVLSGDTIFRDIAIKHADTTMKNHFRDDYSSYHLVDYDPETGEVRKKQTAQGYSDDSAWSRGQAWGLYGYILCYRYTKDVKYLDQAEKIYRFIFTHKNLPVDLVPYWDFNAPNIPDELRDVSSAAIIASALYELNQYKADKGYKDVADKIVENLSSEAYMASPGTNGNFMLMHSVGSIPHKSEIDVPLNYADYYYLEARWRKQQTENNKALW